MPTLLEKWSKLAAAYGVSEEAGETQEEKGKEGKRRRRESNRMPPPLRRHPETHRLTDKAECAFLAKVIKEPGGCWLWHGSVQRDGYARFWIGPGKTKTMLAHRVWWEHLFGPIGETADGERLTLHHDCYTKHCVNPAHLQALTHAAHMAWHKAHDKPMEIVHLPPDHPDYDDALG